MTPTTADQWRQAALEAGRRRDHRGAAQALARAVALSPGDVTLRAELALERLNMGDHAGARAEVLTAGGMPGAEPRALEMLGHVLCRVRDFDGGVALFRRAATAAPNDVSILKNLAWGAQYVGAFDEAKAALSRVLAVAPDDAMAWFNLSGLPDWKPTDDAIAALERLVVQIGQEPEPSLVAGHALARALETRDRHDEALAALTRAKAAAKAAKGYDIQQSLELFEAAPEAWRIGPAGDGDPSQAPIFVVGPPRSGTTLLDRILSSHRDIASAGELPAMTALALAASGQNAASPLNARAMLASARGPAGQMGAAYLRAAAGVVGSPRRFVDKRPFNLIMAGMISRILPNARILRMRRDPADTVVGNYRQLFNIQSLFHDYSYDLADTARYVAGLETLSETWEQLLPADRYRVIDYEALVADPESQIRAALDFCGLDWDPACLDFHRNAAAVATASAVQVREPLHDRNTGVWKRYGAGLEPALAVLRAEGRLA